MLWTDQDAFTEYDSLDWTIWGMLEVVHGFWWDTMCSYWAVNGYSRPESNGTIEGNFDSEFEAGRQIRAMGEALSITPGLPAGREPPTFTESQQKDLRRYLRNLSKHPVARDRIALDIASDELRRLRGSELRVARLAGLVHGRGLTPTATLFIGRATRLFIAGFEVEAAIMCRSALEGALIERCREDFNQDGYPPSLDQLLEKAGRIGYLDGFEPAPSSRKGWRSRKDSQLWRAEQLKWLGNHLIHESPDWSTNPTTLADAFEAIRDLSIVLGWLFPAPTFE
jgi:hypothetical protein